MRGDGPRKQSLVNISYGARPDSGRGSAEGIHRESVAH
jgi:hypothetical protein